MINTDRNTNPFNPKAILWANSITLCSSTFNYNNNEDFLGQTNKLWNPGLES